MSDRPLITFGREQLRIADIVAIARAANVTVALDEGARGAMRPTADWVETTVAALDGGERLKAYYGINTGFGGQAGRSALKSRQLTHVLGRNLMASHAVGVGPWFHPATVRAALAIRAQSLAQGYSGVRPQVVEHLCATLNAGIYPAIPELGSLGASGDLAPLAHLLLVLTAPPHEPDDPAESVRFDRSDGLAFLPCATPHPGEALHLTEDHASAQQQLWRQVSGEEAMRAAGGKLRLEPKEALALINGSAFSAGLACLTIADAERLIANAELAVAMTLEAIRGFRDPLFLHVHRARRHEAAAATAARTLGFLDGSTLADPGDLDHDPARVPPQDPYSVRCAPQVHGAILDTLAAARGWVEREINAATDNPLIFLDLPRDYKAVSGGNFHGEPIAFAMDFLGIAMTELGSIAERRMYMLMDYHPDQQDVGLSPFLIDEPAATAGLNSGLMMLQATAAALVSDCRTLAHPDSVDSAPSSGGQEDHVSMSLNAARHGRDIVRNIEQVIALEVLCAAQGMRLQLAKTPDRSVRPGKGTGAALAALADAGIDMVEHDRVLATDIRTATRMVRDGSLLRAAGGNSC